MMSYYWGTLSGISSDVWVTSLAKLQITVTDAATKSILWEATANKKIQDPRNLRINFRRTWTNLYKKQ
jgi:hypothetical protein